VLVRKGHRGSGLVDEEMGEKGTWPLGVRYIILVLPHTSYYILGFLMAVLKGRDGERSGHSLDVSSAFEEFLLPCSILVVS
jgi:hypothetical protein